MEIFKRTKWEPVFSSEDESEARIVMGLLEGYGLKVKLLGDPAEPYPPQPPIRGMAGRWGRFLVFVPRPDLERAEEIIRDYADDREGDG